MSCAFNGDRQPTLVLGTGAGLAPRSDLAPIAGKTLQQI
jgi:hypothetical protein